MQDIVTTTWIVRRLAVETQGQINLEQLLMNFFRSHYKNSPNRGAVILDETEEAKVRAIASQ